MLKLYDYYRSSAAYRVRIALNLKQCEYQSHPIHLLNNGGEQYSAEYKRINPLSLVPSLQDGDLIINESIAIIEYLDEKFPSPPLLPNDMTEKARIRAFALTIVADTHPLCNLRVGKYLTDEFNATDVQRKQWIQHWIHLGFSALETQLTEQQLATTKFCFGNTPSLADVCLVPQFFSAQRFECDLTRFPTLKRIVDNCNELSAFANAYPVEPVTV